MPLATRTTILGSFAVALLTCVSATQAQEAFTNIADNTGLLQYFGPASINASGKATFYAIPYAGGSSIFTGSGGALTTIAASGGQFSKVSNGNPRINDSGTVAFAGVLTAGGSGIYIGNGGAVTPVVDTSGPLSAGFSDPDINNSGTVAFETATDSFQRGIFRSNGSTLTTIADTSGRFNGFFLPTLNDSGTVAFQGRFDVGGDGIFTGSGGALTTIADTNAGTNPDPSVPFKDFGFGNSPAINDSGTVAFFGNLKTGASGIFTGNGGAITTIADTSGRFSGFTEQASINSSGAVAFFATLDAGGSGIFTGSGSGTQKVIQTGDALFGSTVTTLQVYTHAFNDVGQIGFYYELENGQSGVALASPVPEPGTLVGGFFGSIAGVFLLRRRRNRKTSQEASV